MNPNADLSMNHHRPIAKYIKLNLCPSSLCGASKQNYNKYLTNAWLPSHSENAEGYVLIAVYLFIYLYVCYLHNSKSIKLNRMKFGGMIGYYPGTIWLDWDRSGQRPRSWKGTKKVAAAKVCTLPSARSSCKMVSAHTTDNTTHKDTQHFKQFE